MKINFDTLKSKFQAELEKYSHYITSDLDKAKETYLAISKYISEIDFINVAVELTPFNSFKITLILKDDIMLMISKPFEKLEDLDEDSVIYSIFEEEELLISDTSKIDKLVNGFRKYYNERTLKSLFEKERNNYFHYIKDIDEELISKKVYDTISLISTFSYQQTSIELTQDHSVFFSIKLDNETQLHLEIYFKPNGGVEKGAFFRLYVKKQCIVSSVGTLLEILEEIKKCIIFSDTENPIFLVDKYKL